MNPRGTLYIIAAASGTGKTSLTAELARTVDRVKISISYTTRPIRANEKADEHYFFVSPLEFEKLIKEQALLEYAQVFDNYYGTPRKMVEESLAAGFDVILDIDWQGARQIRERIECTTIFLLPPSHAELRLRLERRKRESPEAICERLAKASSEISHYKEFDYVIINDKFERALLDLQAIIYSKRLQLKNQLIKYSSLIKELLKSY